MSNLINLKTIWFTESSASFLFIQANLCLSEFGILFTLNLALFFELNKYLHIFLPKTDLMQVSIILAIHITVQAA